MLSGMSRVGGTPSLSIGASTNVNACSSYIYIINLLGKLDSVKMAASPGPLLVNATTLN